MALSQAGTRAALCELVYQGTPTANVVGLCHSVQFTVEDLSKLVGIPEHEVTFLAAKAGTRIAEVPIVFVERRLGASKLSWPVLLESLATPWRLASAHGRLRPR